MKAFVEKNKHMKAFVKKKPQYVLSEGFCQKVHVLIKNECN